MADWLRLAELLTERAPELLDGLGFPERYSDILRAFADSSPPDEPPIERELRIESLERLADLDPELSEQAWDKSITLAFGTTTPASPAADNGSGFPVDRVLRDL